MSIVTLLAGKAVGDILCDPELLTLHSSTLYESNPNENRTGGNLQVSDSPETVGTNSAVMFYSPVNKGQNTRIYFDHLYSGSGTATLQVVLRNTGAATAIITPPSTGWSGTSKNASAPTAGKNALIQYLQQHIVATTFINPSSQVDLVALSGSNPIDFSGIADFQSSQDIGLYVVMNTPSLDSASSYLPQVTHSRGTFTGSEVANTLTPTYLMSHSSQNTIFGMSIGRRSITGTDDTGLGYTGGTTVTSTLPGSFGVRYDLKFPIYNDTASTQCFGVLLNPRGGEYAGAVYDTGTASVVQAPASVVSVSGSTCAVVVSRDYLGPGSGITKEFLTIPPAGSSMPVDFLVVPCS